jgi:hypothetical protein
MNFNEIRSKAKKLGINSHRMKKTELIQAIQRAENNIACYGTDRVDYCGEDSCLWRPDCLALDQGKKASG